MAKGEGTKEQEVSWAMMIEMGKSKKRFRGWKVRSSMRPFERVSDWMSSVRGTQEHISCLRDQLYQLFCEWGKSADRWRILLWQQVGEKGAKRVTVSALGDCSRGLTTRVDVERVLELSRKQRGNLLSKIR